MLISMRRSIPRFREGRLLRAISFAEQRKRLANGQLAPPGLVDQAIKLIADGGQLEPVEHRHQVIMLHHQRPPTSRSYSISGRSSSGSAVPAAGASATKALDWKPDTPAKCRGSM
jgi:hypothetical protein